MKIRFRNCKYCDCKFILKFKELGIKWYAKKIYGWDKNIQREKTKCELDKFIDTMRIIVIDNIDIARKENKIIRIKTYKYNSAKKLYERLGFKQYNEDDTHIYLRIDFNN